jgi:hypothetical protein
MVYPKALQEELSHVAINVPLLFGSFSKPISAFWDGLSNPHEYEKLQLFIRNLFSTHLEFNQFFKNFFNLSLEELKKTAKMNNS